jgi:hypothetical protein
MSFKKQRSQTGISSNGIPQALYDNESYQDAVNAVFDRMPAITTRKIEFLHREGWSAPQMCTILEKKDGKPIPVQFVHGTVKKMADKTVRPTIKLVGPNVIASKDLEVDLTNVPMADAVTDAVDSDGEGDEVVLNDTTATATEEPAATLETVSGLASDVVPNAIPGSAMSRLVKHLDARTGKSAS